MADSLLPEDNQTSDRDSLLAKWKDKTPEEVLNAKVESDLYIKTLTARFDDLKKDYLDIKDRQQASEDLKTLLDQVKKERLNPDTSTTTQVESHQPAIKPEEIEALVQKQVSEKLTEYQRSLRQQENFNAMQAKLKEHLGENYQAAYKQRLDNLGISKEFADELARNQPGIFMKTFELETRQVAPFQAPPRSAVRQTDFAPNTPKRDWNYYQELKKTNPKIYLDPKIANQMHDDAIALGADFGMPET